MNERMQDFYQWILANPGHSEREIARGVGLASPAGRPLKKTPYTRQILFALIAEGNIVRLWDDSRHPGAYVYSIQQTDELPL